jgi:F-type H+-transporting ATPase subunit delta
MADPNINVNVSASVMEDPSAQAIARTYADALLDAAVATGAGSALDEVGSFVEDGLDKVPDLKQMLFSRVIAREEKIRLIEKIAGPPASPIVASFLRVLAGHDRLDLLPLILREARLRQEVRSGRKRVQVTTARPLTGESESHIRHRLAESLPFDPILETRVDPSLLGGIVIRVGDTVYDSSLATRIKELRQRLQQRSLHEIQSGRDRFSNPERD